MQQLLLFLQLHVMHYLDPLPDIFALQLSCKRFYELAHDSRAWITVSPSDDPRSPTASQHHHEVRVLSYRIKRELVSFAHIMT